MKKNNSRDLKEATMTSEKLVEQVTAGGLWNDNPYEQVLNEEGEPAFLAYRKNPLLDRQFEKTGDYRRYYTEAKYLEDESGLTYIPMRDALWELARLPLPEKRLSHNELWAKIRAFVINHLDLVDERQYDVLTAWIITTYVLEKWMSVPYISFLGPTNSGKTRALECLRHLCYRGLLVANISMAALYREIENNHPTVLLDETEAYVNEQRGEMIGLLNSGYRRGQYVIRVNLYNMKENLKYKGFGFKAFAGTKTLIDTLTGRCVIINMFKATREINFFLDRREAARLRMHLLLWRLEQRTELGNLDEYDNLQRKAEAIREELPDADARMIEKYYPLLEVANMGRQSILDYANNAVEIEGYANESTIEAEVTQVLVNCHDKVYKGVLKNTDIKAEFNKNRDEREKWGTGSITAIIRRVGLFKKRSTDGHRGYIYDTKKIEGLCKRYGVSSTPEASTSTQHSPTLLLEPLDSSYSSNPSSLPGFIVENIEDKPCTRCGKIPDKLYPDAEEAFYICKPCKQKVLGEGKP